MLVDYHFIYYTQALQAYYSICVYFSIFNTIFKNFMLVAFWPFTIHANNQNLFKLKFYLLQLVSVKKLHIKNVGYLPPLTINYRIKLFPY